MPTCAYCSEPLTEGPPWAPEPGHRLAYDPHRGRLWTVCPRCTRWNLTPMEQRWETLEACEAAVEVKGRLRLATEHLRLLEVEEGELIRVSGAPRPEFVDWRYGPRLSSGRPRPGFWERVITAIPAAPVEGYDPYAGILGRQPDPSWFASPFLESASPLTYLFAHVPLAPGCPSCARPLALRPWSFQDLRFLAPGGRVEVLAQCGFCGEDIHVPLTEARPALRLGLSIVVPPPLLRRAAEAGLEELDGRGGPAGFLDDLCRAASPLGHLETRTRAGLIIALDELAEGEALESEWRTAEELAAISDGELTRVPGFREFRRRILGTDR